MKVILMQGNYLNGKKMVREKVTHIKSDIANVTLTYSYGGKAMREDFLNTIVKEVFEVNNDI